MLRSLIPGIREGRSGVQCRTTAPRGVVGGSLSGGSRRADGVCLRDRQEKEVR